VTGERPWQPLPRWVPERQRVAGPDGDDGGLAADLADRKVTAEGEAPQGEERSRCGGLVRLEVFYSHSIVAGGFDEMS
jgi:hypothetical protein